LEVAPDTSLTSCLRTFSKVETMGGDDKLHCEKCGRLQEAQKRLRVLALPKVLCLHLKRFKYLMGGDGNNANGGYYSAPRMRKLGHRVAFPRELRLGPVVASAGCPDADATLRLTAVVVHVGAGASHGHYIAFVRVRKAGKGKKEERKGEEEAREEKRRSRRRKGKKKKKGGGATAAPPRPLDDESSEEEEDKMDEDRKEGNESSGSESEESGSGSGSEGDDDARDEEEKEEEEEEEEEEEQEESSDSDSDSDSSWLLLDDDAVERAAPGALAATFGATRGGSFGGVDHGYILMYERCDS
jgi:hypothetical protein